MGSKVSNPSLNDRIVEINGYRLMVHQNIDYNRRNVICYSRKMDEYILRHNLTEETIKNKIKINEFFNENQFDDIVIMKVDGYY